MSFTNLTTGKIHLFRGKYLELRSHERLFHTDRFDDPSLPAEMVVAVALRKFPLAQS